MSLAHANRYQAGIANSMLKTIAGAGHLPHFKAAEQRADLISDFLRAPMA